VWCWPPNPIQRRG